MNPESKDYLPTNSVGTASASRRILTQTGNTFFQMLEGPANWLHLVAGSLLLGTLVLAVYQPVLPGNFLMDDWRLTYTDNGLVNGQFTPYNLWFQTDFTLSAVALYWQWLAWGHSPGAYHLVNLLLHTLSAILLWRLLAKLKIPAAWLAAALYAVHPVCVNSVARIAEIKNTLSLPFYLLSLLAYLHYESSCLYPGGEDAPSAPRPRPAATGWYLLALTAFLAALLSKTSTVMLPVVLLACALWQRRRVGRQDWLHSAPFFLLAAAFGVMSIWFQKHQALFSIGATLPPESFWQRLAGAGQVFSFYLGKAVWPFDLNLVYPHSRLSLTAFLPYLLFALGLAWCWRFPFTRARHVLFGLGCFAITLFPVMGFFDSQFLTVWQVSDHLQYLPLIAPVALAAAGLGAMLGRSAFRVAGGMVLLILALLAFQRASVFASEEKLFLDSIAKNPAAAGPQNDLGVVYARRKDLADASKCFSAAVAADPANVDALSNLGQAQMLAGNLAAAETNYQAALALKPYDVETHKRFAQLLRHEGRNREAAYHYLVALRFQPDLDSRLDLATLYYQTRQAAQAVAQYRQILKTKPDDVEALNDLGWILATSGDETIRNGPAAITCAETACSLTGYRQARSTGTLAAAYAEAGRFPEAVAAGQNTVRLAEEAGDQRLAYIGGQLLGLYRSNRPYHEPLPVIDSGK